MQRLILVLAATCCAVAFCATPAAAAPITFIHTGTGSGSLAGVPFGDSAFTITAFGDTANREAPFPNVFTIAHDAASIEIAGLGTLTFTTQTLTFVNNTTWTVGVLGANPAIVDLYDGPIDPVFKSWDMLSSIGPVFGPDTGRLLNWTSSGGLATNQGTLIFNDRLYIPATFQAIVSAPVPAPGAVLLVALGAGLVGWLRRRGTV